jgi:WD40 repeat protein
MLLHREGWFKVGRLDAYGGRLDNDQYIDSAELYDPTSSRFTTTGKLVAHSRAFALVTQLSNGKVLVAGGEAPYEGQDPISFLFSAELYDPSLGVFKETGSFVPSQGAHRLEGPTTATLLGNGKVLFAPLFMEDGTAQLYDPSKGRFEVTGSFSEKRVGSTATLLLNGKVLFAGGRNIFAKNLVSAELYDSTIGTFKLTGSLSKARVGHTATLLQNGKVLVTGGYTKESPIASAEIYDPATGRFASTGDLQIARAGHTATLLKNGKVLIAGGRGDDGELVNLELYNPDAGLFKSAGRLIEAGHRYTATLLLDGRVLFLGRGAAELYDPVSSQ